MLNIAMHARFWPSQFCPVRFCPVKILAIRCWLVIFVSAACIGCLSGTANAEDEGQESLRKLFETQVFQGADGTLPYRILPPQNIQDGKQYPLVLFFHGSGERGVDNKQQLKHGAFEFAQPDRREKYPAFVVCPQCPKAKRWVESDWTLKSGRGQFPKKPSESMQLALELVDALTIELPIDKNRRYVAGLSMGGQAAWFAAAQKPRRFAAMLEVCGGGDPELVPNYEGIPIWAFHGQADNVVPVDRGREMIVALTQAGHAPELRYVEYPGVKHDSWTRTFARDDVFEWLFQQKRR